MWPLYVLFNRLLHPLCSHNPVLSNISIGLPAIIIQKLLVAPAELSMLHSMFYLKIVVHFLLLILMYKIKFVNHASGGLNCVSTVSAKYGRNQCFVLACVTLLRLVSHTMENRNVSLSCGSFLSLSGGLSRCMQHTQLICEHSCCFYLGYVKEGTTGLRGSGIKVDLMWHLISYPIWCGLTLCVCSFTYFIIWVAVHQCAWCLFLHMRTLTCHLLSHLLYVCVCVYVFGVEWAICACSTFAKCSNWSGSSSQRPPARSLRRDRKLLHLGPASCSSNPARWLDWNDWEEK